MSGHYPHLQKHMSQEGRARLRLVLTTAQPGKGPVHCVFHTPLRLEALAFLVLCLRGLLLEGLWGFATPACTDARTPSACAPTLLYRRGKG